MFAAAAPFPLPDKLATDVSKAAQPGADSAGGQAGDRHVPVPCLSPEGPELRSRRTIGALWLESAAARGPRPAYLVETDEGWRPVSWAEAAARVDDLANGLLALGLAKGEPFGILASTRLEWVLFDYALALVGAIAVPVYPTSSPRDCAYALDHAGAVGVLVEDEAQRAKLGAQPPSGLRHVLTFADLDGLAARGRAHRASHPDALAAAASAIDEDDLYTYIYTSGTSGPQKACMIRHRNYHAMATAVAEVEVEDLVGPDDVVLLYLPLAHNFGRLLHLVGTVVGFTTALCPDPYAVAEALPHVRPTLLPSVPRLFEKVHGAAIATFAAQRGPRRLLVSWALRVGREAGAFRAASRPLPRRLALQHRLADALVYSKFKERLGGRLRYAVSGGAPLSPEVARFFQALDVVVLEGYGLTECTAAATVNRPHRYRFGTVGLPLPGFEVRTAADGELLVRSETIFAGYLGDPDATRLALDGDGWLRTGDIGEIDADGFVRVTDRKKDIIVTAGGKKIAPQNLENELKSSPLVSQALVVGDRRPYVTALVTLDPAEAAGHADPVAAVQALVDAVNRDRTRFEQIKRFAILPRDFSADEGEVTPTLKLRRRVCEAHFAAEIEALYAGPSPPS